ncbi:unnamed protein product [Nesidiocoris tenuis]|uniref:Uncharacterized protein n=1 Tax=Nesidiocoris tenuis TaxID=355587 RepID=A0A6H5HEP9_9HEMI|nr:unnamed protein product [Nesidiocoris tenuis]
MRKTHGKFDNCRNINFKKSTHPWLRRFPRDSSTKNCVGRFDQVPTNLSARHATANRPRSDGKTARERPANGFRRRHDRPDDGR